MDFLPDSLATLVSSSARRVLAIRLGVHQHLCATLWSSDVAVTCSRFLPEQESYLLLLDQGHAIAHLAWRDEATGLAGLRLAVPHPLPACPSPGPIEADTWLISIGVDEAASPIASLAAPRNSLDLKNGSPLEYSFTLEQEASPSNCGGPLIAPSGALAGILTCNGATASTAGWVRVVSYLAVTRLVGATHLMAVTPAAPPAWPPARIGRKADSPRGWLGLSLQPSLLAPVFFAVAGQSSGRKVINVIPNGPADRAGLQLGDIVLTIADQSMVGDGAVREYLYKARIGETAPITLLRSGKMVGLTITVSETPAD